MEQKKVDFYVGYNDSNQKKMTMIEIAKYEGVTSIVAVADKDKKKVTVTYVRDIFSPNKLVSKLENKLRLNVDLGSVNLSKVEKKKDEKDNNKKEDKVQKQNVVLQLGDEKQMNHCMEAVAKLEQVESISKEKGYKLKFTGTADVVKVVQTMRKKWPTSIVSLAPNNDKPGEKKDEGKKDEGKKDNTTLQLSYTNSGMKKAMGIVAAFEGVESISKDKNGLLKITGPVKAAKLANLLEDECGKGVEIKSRNLNNNKPGENKKDEGKATEKEKAIQKVVIKLAPLYDDELVQRAMKSVTQFGGLLDSISIEAEKNLLTMVGTADAVDVVCKLKGKKKFEEISIVSVGPNKKEGEKEAAEKAKKNEDDQKNEYPPALEFSDPNNNIFIIPPVILYDKFYYNLTQCPHYYVQEDPTDNQYSCVIC